MYDQDRLRAIEERAEREAGGINTSLAAQIAEMEDCRAAYLPPNGKPLEINVPFWPAFFSGRFQLFMNAPRTYWQPHSEGKPPKSGGLYIEWGTFKVLKADGSTPKDSEQFTVYQIIEAPPPDIDYVFYIDWVRGLQSKLNVLRRLFGLKKL